MSSRKNEGITIRTSQNQQRLSATSFSLQEISATQCQFSQNCHC